MPSHANVTFIFTHALPLINNLSGARSMMKEVTDGKSTAAGSLKFKHQQWAKRYVDGDSLIDIARGADVPPCTLLRIVLPHLTTLDKYVAVSRLF